MITYVIMKVHTTNLYLSWDIANCDYEWIPRLQDATFFDFMDAAEEANERENVHVIPVEIRMLA